MDNRRLETLEQAKRRFSIQFDCNLFATARQEERSAQSGIFGEYNSSAPELPETQDFYLAKRTEGQSGRSGLPIWQY